MSQASDKPRVAIVLCTYNGADHLQGQLDSLAKQSWPISVFAFDDGSTDNTLDILESNKATLDISIFSNSENLGYVDNFEQGISHAVTSGYHYIALCDQDDLWDEERIAAGMQRIVSAESINNKAPTLAHCDLTMVDSSGKTVHDSFFAYRRYNISAEKALPTVLGQNGVMGNTILMNSALAKLALPFPPNLHVHDYWLAVLVELYGQRLLLDDALVKYRIHNSNASNPNDAIKFGIEKHTEHKSWQGFIARDYRLPFKEDARLDVITTLLDESDRLPTMTPEQRQKIELFQDYLEFKKPRVQLLYQMLKAGFYRKGFKHRLRLVYSMLLTARYN